MQVLVDSNSGGGGWVRFNVQQTGGRGAIQAVQMQGSDGSWQDLNNVRSQPQTIPALRRAPAKAVCVQCDSAFRL